jgi:FkbM family methyltransferase
MEGMNMKIAQFVPKPVKLAMSRLLQRKSLNMSQAGQDFWVFGEVFNEQRQGYFLDIGAHDGIYTSNTYLLESRYDWHGICVEADPESFAQLKKNRKAICVNACLDYEEGIVDFLRNGLMSGIMSPKTDNRCYTDKEVIQLRTNTLLSVLRDCGAPHCIDYLSIDVEGAEEKVLGSFDFHDYRFNCITIERPTEATRIALRENAYILIKDIPGLDCFYIHESFLHDYVANALAFYHKKYVVGRWR